MRHATRQHDERLLAFAAALQSSDEEGSVRELVRALQDGVGAAPLQRTIMRVMAEDAEELHSLIYVAAAFDLAAGLGSEAGKYALAASAVQIARQPKDSKVAAALESARSSVGGRRPVSVGEAERALAAALDRSDVEGAIESTLQLHHVGRDAGFVLSCFAKWAARPVVVEKPPGYVSHLLLQTAAAWDLLKYGADIADAQLLTAHLAYCQVELSRRYTLRAVESAADRLDDPAEALVALRQSIHESDLPALGPLIDAAWTRPQAVEEVGRVLMKCAVEQKGGLSHRFTLADAARRIARRVHPAIARAVLHHASLSIANGYPGAKRLLEARDLPHAHPGGSDYAGRLLVGITSNNLAEAHAALRGLFESGTSPRQVAVAVLEAASHVDSKPMRSDHPFIVSQAAWRAIADGFFAGEALPLLAELAVVLAAAPKDHDIIQQVEEAAEAHPARA